jgi:hypothetical protein
VQVGAAGRAAQGEQQRAERRPEDHADDDQRYEYEQGLGWPGASPLRDPDGHAAKQSSAQTAECGGGERHRQIPPQQAGRRVRRVDG